MRILLDTHIFLWLITNDRRLTAVYRTALADPANEVFLSVVSLWEILVKYRLGRLTFTEPPEVLLPRERDAHRIQNLTLDEASVLRSASLPTIHGDPFDRMLVSQALNHSLTIATADAVVRTYPAAFL